MLVENLKRLLQFLLLLALQVFLFNHIHIMGYATPLVYVALLLYMPANENRITTLVWAFIMGYCVDLFSITPGMSAASLTLTAMLRNGLLSLMIPKDSLENMVPTYKTMGAWNHLHFMTILLLIHHFTYFVLESFSIFNLRDLCLMSGGSFVLSWIAIALMELLRGEK